MRTSHLSRHQHFLRISFAVSSRGVRSLFLLLVSILFMAGVIAAQENKQYTQNKPDQALKKDE